MSTAGVVYFVGYNPGSFGLGHKTPQSEPIKCTNKLISKIYSSRGFAIYSDNDHKKLFAAGNNQMGQCGTNSTNNNHLRFQPITYFKKAKSMLKKYVSVWLKIHFITDNGQLYGCEY